MILHSSLAICILRMKKDVTSLQNSESCDNNSFKNKSNRRQLVYSIAFFILLVGHSFSFCTFTLFLCLYLLHFDVFYSLLWKKKKLSALPFPHFCSLFCKVLIFNAFVRNRCKKMISTWIQYLKKIYTWHDELFPFLFIYVMPYYKYRNYHPKYRKENQELHCNNWIKIY